VATHRTLLTFDKDFGELAYRRGLPADCGIVLFRITPQTPEEVAVLAVTAIKSQPTWAGSFQRRHAAENPRPATPCTAQEQAELSNWFQKEKWADST